jgi:hypothetical protein
MEPTINSFPTQPKKNNVIPTVVVAVVLLSAIIGSYLIIRQPKKVEEKKDTIVQTVEPTPTEKPKKDKALVKVQVINGTGTPGQAGEVVKSLKDAGYAEDNIKTGNAEEFDNTTTTIEAKTDFEEIANDIRDLLKATFSEITVESSKVDAESEFDIVIVTGGKIFATATPKPTEPAATPTGSLTPTPTTQLTTTPTATPTSTPSPAPTP